jgi:hypothetical protein
MKKSSVTPVCTFVVVMWTANTVNSLYLLKSDIPRGVWGFKPPPPKFWSFDKAQPNSQFPGKYIQNNPIRIRVSFICKLSGTPDWGATAPKSPFFVPPVLNWICCTPPPPPNKIPGYATDMHLRRCCEDLWALTAQSGDWPPCEGPRLNSRFNSQLTTFG